MATLDGDDVVRALRAAAAREAVGGRHRGPERSGARRRGRAARALLAVAVVAGFVALATTGVVARGMQRAGRERSAAPAAAARADRVPSWSEVVRDLDAERAADVAAGRAPAVDLDGSSLQRSDSRAVAGLRRAGLVARGFGLDVSAVRLVASAPGRVDLRVTDTRPAYDLVRPDGSVARHVTSRGRRVWLVRLRRVDGAWRFADVTARE